MVWLRSCSESAGACAAVLRVHVCLVLAACLPVLYCVYSKSVVALMLCWLRYGDCDWVQELAEVERSFGTVLVQDSWVLVCNKALGLFFFAIPHIYYGWPAD